MSNLQELKREKNKLYIKLMTLINDFQKEYDVNLKIDIYDGDIKEMGRDFYFKEANIKVEL